MSTESFAGGLPPLSALPRRPLLFLALGFGAGLSPRAPGTAGTLVALPLAVLLQPLAWPAQLGVIVLAFAAGVFLCGRASAELGVADHPAIVWDEIVGYLLAVCGSAGLAPLALGFLLFRGFDILKPWPISWLDRRVHGGLGIMLDDIVAGLAAWGCLQGILFLL